MAFIANRPRFFYYEILKNTNFPSIIVIIKEVPNMYCINCGAKCPDTETVCANCKKKLNFPNNSESKEPAKDNQMTSHDSMGSRNKSFWGYAFVGFLFTLIAAYLLIVKLALGYAIAVFLFPLICLISYQVLRILTPHRAKSAEKGALLGVVVASIILFAVTFVLYIAPSMTDIHIGDTSQKTQTNALAANLIFISGRNLTRQSGEEGTIQNGEEDLIYDEEDVLLDGSYIESATAQTLHVMTSTHTEDYAVFIKFNAKGTKKYQDITRDLIGEQLCILYNNKVICATFVGAEITDGNAVILGGLNSLEEATELAAIFPNE